MSDAFVPEADRLDQDRDVGPAGEDVEDRPASTGREPVLRVPLEAPEADVLEQSQEVVDDGYE